MYRLILFLFLTVPALNLPADDIVTMYRSGNYKAVVDSFNRLSAAPSAERNKTAHFAVLSFGKLKNYPQALALSEKMIAENKDNKAWECRFKLHQMKALGQLGRQQEALKIIPDADAVPPAFTGEFYCLQGELLELDDQWRKAVEAYDHGAQASNNFAGRAKLMLGKAYEKNGFPLPALEAYLQMFSMLNATTADRLEALSGALRMLDKVDRNREEVQDVLLILPAELKVAEAGKAFKAGNKAGAAKMLDEIAGNTSLPLSLRDFTGTMRRGYE